MDEKSMILEQERQEKAKKRRKYRKLKWIAGGLAGVLLIGGVWYVVKGRSLMMTSQTTMVEIEAAADQTVVYAKILSIYGNEITYVVTEEPVTMQADMNVAGEMPQGGGGFGGGGEMPQGGGFGGERPQQGSGGRGENSVSSGNRPMIGDGEIPENGENPEAGMSNAEMANGAMQSGGVPGGQMPGEEMPGNQMPDGQMPNGEIPDGEMPQMPGQAQEETDVETITTYIPVGTEVITKLGTVTTFSRLAAGDTVALVTETDGDEQVIMSVYIVD